MALIPAPVSKAGFSKIARFNCDFDVYFAAAIVIRIMKLDGYSEFPLGRRTEKTSRTLKAHAPESQIMPRWQALAVLAAILAVYVALRLPGIGVPLDRDEGAFGYMGQLIRNGRLPYQDGLDHKPPVAFYINALALTFVPPTEHGIHGFLLVYNLLTLICIFYLGKTYFQSLSAGLWAAFAYAVFSASPAIQGFTASTEMWMLLPIASSLWLAVLGTHKNSHLFLILSGIAGATACWTKQTAFTSILFVFLLTIVATFRRNHDAPSPARAAIRASGAWL
jgi:hypothetical protein